MLPNGANGPVSFTEVPCSAVEADCDTEVNLFGNFKDNAGQPLYSNANPATITWKCPGTVCPYVQPETGYGENIQEQWVDFETYKIEVSLRNDDGTYTPFESPASATRSRRPVGGCDAARSRTSPAQSPGGKGFCIDVYTITRDGGSFTGDLTIPVLFVEDPKLRGI